MRRTLVAGLAACLALGASTVPAGAERKPKKPPRFEASGAVAVGHPGDAAGVNATRAGFLQACAIPPSQGVDGYVIELPREITARNSNVEIDGADLTGLHDLGLHFFDESCASNGALASDLPDEFGLMPRGTRYVLVTAAAGVEVTFTFRAEGV